VELADVTDVEPVGGTPPWQDAAWLAQVAAWIDEQLAQAGFERAGPLSLRGRAWSVVVRVPAVDRNTLTRGGAADPAPRTLWFKADPPDSAFEPALVAALAQWAPGIAPPPLAVDTARAWSLSRDAGTHLRETLERDRDPRHLLPLIRRYARHQHALAARQADLLALGLPDLRPRTLPERFSALLADPAIRAALGSAQRDALDAHLPLVRAYCRRLEAYGLPATLDHGDLHPSNIFGQGEAALASDWGDASLSHPFNTLLVLLRSTYAYFDTDELAQLHRACLEPWLDDSHTLADLEHAARLALRLAPVSRAYAWSRTFPCFAAADEPNANAARWLAHLLEDDPVGAGLGGDG